MLNLRKNLLYYLRGFNWLIQENEKWKVKQFDPYVIRTRNLLIWSQTRYRCAKESCLGSAFLLIVF